MPLSSTFFTESGLVTLTIKNGTALLLDQTNREFEVVSLGALEIDIADIQSTGSGVEVYERLGNIDVTAYDVLNDGLNRLYAELANALQNPNHYLEVEMHLAALDNTLGESTTKFLLYREGIEYDVVSEETKMKLVAKPKSGYVADETLTQDEQPVFPPPNGTGFDMSVGQLATSLAPSEKLTVIPHPEGSQNEADWGSTTLVAPASKFIEQFIKSAYGVNSVQYAPATRDVAAVQNRELLTRTFSFPPFADQSRPELAVSIDGSAFMQNIRAVDVVDRLAAQEGSYYGALFGVGYFVNRYSQQGGIVNLSYDDVLELSIESTKEKVGQTTTTLRPFTGGQEPEFTGDIKVKYGKLESGKSFDVNSYILGQVVGYPWRTNNADQFAVKWASLPASSISISQTSDSGLYRAVASASAVGYSNMLGLTVAKNIRIKKQGIGSIMPWNRVQFTTDQRFPNFNITVGGQPVNYRPYKFKYDIVNDEVEVWLYPILSDNDIALIEDDFIVSDELQVESVTGNVTFQEDYIPPTAGDPFRTPIGAVLWNNVRVNLRDDSSILLPNGAFTVPYRTEFSDEVIIGRAVPVDIRSTVQTQIYVRFVSEATRDLILGGGITSFWLHNEFNSVQISVVGVAPMEGKLAGTGVVLTLATGVEFSVSKNTVLTYGTDPFVSLWEDYIFVYDRQDAIITGMTKTVYDGLSNALMSSGLLRYIRLFEINRSLEVFFGEQDSIAKVRYGKINYDPVFKSADLTRSVEISNIIEQLDNRIALGVKAVTSGSGIVDEEGLEYDLVEGYSNDIVQSVESKIEVLAGSITSTVQARLDDEAIAIVFNAIPQGQTVTSIRASNILGKRIKFRAGDEFRIYTDGGDKQTFVLTADVDIPATQSIFELPVSSTVALFRFPFGATIFDPVNIGSEIRQLADEITLKVDNNGSLVLVKLSADPSTGSAFEVAADNIDLQGVTNFLTTDTAFLNNLAAGLAEVPSFGLVTVYRQATQPVGGEYIMGDVWIQETVVGGLTRNIPWVWDGTGWVRQVTIVDGGEILTGTIDAARLDVGQIFTNLEPSVLTAILSNSSRVIVSPTEPVGSFDIGDVWVKSDDPDPTGDPAYRWDGATWVIAFTHIQDDTITTAKIKVRQITGDLLDIVTSDQIRLRATGTEVSDIEQDNGEFYTLVDGSGVDIDVNLGSEIVLTEDRIQSTVAGSLGATGVGVLAVRIVQGVSTTSVVVRGAQAVNVEVGDQITIVSADDLSQSITLTVTGKQNVTGDVWRFVVNAFTPSVSYPPESAVTIPAGFTMSRITQEKNRIDANVVSISANSTAISGLTLRTDGQDVAIANLQTSVNGANTAISALDLRATAIEADYQLSSTLSNDVAGTASFSGLSGRVTAIEADYQLGSTTVSTVTGSSAWSTLSGRVTDNESAITTLQTGVAQINKIAGINGNASGTVTSIPVIGVDVREALRPNTVLYLVKASNPALFDRVVTASSFDTGATTLNVVSVALTNSYVAGDYITLEYTSANAVFEQVGTLDSSVTTINNTLTTNGITGATNITSRVSIAETNIGTNATAITDIGTTLSANGLTGATNITGRVSTVEGAVDTIEAEIVLKAQVGAGNVAQIVLQSIDGVTSGSAITLDADQITITGNTFINDLFGKNITLQTGGFIQGAYTAGSAGFRISADGTSEFSNTTVRGAITANSLSLAGAMTLGAGGSINLNNRFQVDSSGNMTATFANISGTITSNNGLIGGINIDSGGISKAYVVGSAGFKIYGSADPVNGFAIGDAEFNSVTVRGKLATSSITGDLTLSTTGKIQANGYTPANAIAATGSGLFLGYDGSAYKLAIGNAGKSLLYDGTDIIINKGKTVEAINIIGTTGVIKTTENALSGGVGAEAGVIITRDGFYAGTATQTTADANVRILSTGAAFFNGTVTATGGSIGSMLINSNGLQLSGGAGLFNATGGLALNGEGSTSLGLVDFMGMYVDSNNWVGGYDQDLTALSPKAVRFGTDTNYLMIGQNNFRIKSTATDITSTGISTTNITASGGTINGELTISGLGLINVGADETQISTQGISLQSWNLAAKPNLNASPRAIAFRDINGVKRASISSFTDSISLPNDAGLNFDAHSLIFDLREKPTVSGSRGGNAALASLLTALANYGLITDSTT